MAFPWSSKGERSEAEAPAGPGPGGEPQAGLGELVDELGRLGQLVASASEKVAAYLARREVHTAAPSGSDSAALARRIECIEREVGALGRQFGEAAQLLGRLQDQLDRGLERLAASLAPKAAEPSDEPGGVSLADWEKAVLGPDLAADAALAFQRHQLLSGVLEGNSAACALAGQLLIFRSTSPERLAPLLKDIGEAYYRWQPKTRPGNSPFEETLAGWLQRACEQSGLRNTIELVHPGERFDASRHSAASRGVEIAEVFGWIVLRDNGKVYTKANVAVR